MNPWTAALLLALVPGLVGCETFLPEEECEQPMTNAQGDIYRCTAVEDCPRPSHVLLCINDTGAQPECIRCRDTRCIRVKPEACS